MSGFVLRERGIKIGATYSCVVIIISFDFISTCSLKQILVHLFFWQCGSSIVTVLQSNNVKRVKI